MAPLGRDDARVRLETWRKEAECAREESEELQDELPELIQQCVGAGLQKKEIAQIAGLSRTTIHRHTKEAVA